ncbi:MAG: universal stress protein [Alphaproteobacteria bacterium]|nr:universal stress protein [Alphaproteobacteria bacterium]
MAIKRILAVLSGGDPDAAVARAAVQVAGRLSAHVDGLYVRGDFFDTMPYVEGSMSESALSREFAAAQERRQQCEDRARESFDAALAQSDAADIVAEFEAVDGRVLDIVGHRGRVYDLAILSPMGNYPGVAPEDVVASALFDTGRPVLVMPDDAPATLGRRVLVGWNRGSQAARAVAGALPLLRGAEKVTIAHVETGAKTGPGPEELQANLACHGVDSEVMLIAQPSGSVSNTLSEAAAEVSADLMVLGAFSHSRLRETIFGGVTSHFIKRLQLPTLMAH